MFDVLKLRNFRLHVLSVISLAAILLVLLGSDTLVSNLSSHLIHSETEFDHRNHNQPLKPKGTVPEPLSAVAESQNFDEDPSQDYNHLRAPFNLTAEERIIWYKSRLSHLEILKSNELSLQFDDRVSKFLSRGCSVQFFMTWIGPAELFGNREILAVESVFKSNPSGCLIIVSRSMDSLHGTRILRPFLDRGYRVLGVSPDLPILFNNTPAEAWFNDLKNGRKEPGEISLAQNLSNLIRLAVLYKYGGVYLDADVIVLKDFSGLRNSIGAQSIDGNRHWTRLNNAVLIFDKNHPLVYKFIEEFASTFDGNIWGHNGPYLVSRVIQKVGMNKDFNFTVLPPMAFYPADWTRINGYFIRPMGRPHLRWVEAKLRQLNGETYGVHLWHRQSRNLKIEEGSIIGTLISTHCIMCQNIYDSPAN